jgi:F0F1-type ATP synthase membrane subunit c/vacuolar-type H+-ATPase subunit K
MLGAWDVNQMSPLATVVFVFATILEVIVMLNLLIAIVSATSERVTGSSV